MKTTFRFGLPRQIAGLLLVLCYLAVSDGRAAGAKALPLEGSAPETIVSQARLSLAEARKTQSDPRTAVGHYLDAADAAVRSVGVFSGNGAEARSIYNAASQEVAVLLRSSAELWNRTETIPSADGIYRLRFATGSHKEGTWDPGYFDFFRTPRQVHEKDEFERCQCAPPEHDAKKPAFDCRVEQRAGRSLGNTRVADRRAE
jgi:hypothetical protein